MQGVGRESYPTPHAVTRAHVQHDLCTYDPDPTNLHMYILIMLQRAPKHLQEEAAEDAEEDVSHAATTGQ